METQEKPSIRLLSVGGGGCHDSLLVMVSEDFELINLPVLFPPGTFSFFWTRKRAQQSPALYFKGCFKAALTPLCGFSL